MNPRQSVLLTTRNGVPGSSGSSVAASSSNTKTRSISAPSNKIPVGQSQRTISVPALSTPTRTLRTSGPRPSRTNTAVSASPRKSSAPSKLSRVIGNSLESLPSTVSVRRKTSVPARSLSKPATTGVHYNNNNNNNNNNTTTSNNKKKNSSGSSQQKSVSGNRMSKDHHGGGHHGSKASSGTAVNESSYPKDQQGLVSGQQGGKGQAVPAQGQQQHGKAKKGSASTAPEMQTLPTLKEEKKSTKSAKKTSNTSAAVTAASPAMDLVTRRDTKDLRDPFDSHSSVPPGAPPDGGTVGGFAEKELLEKRVSDLVKNAECKRQEIAALRMEINRLKEAAREREHSDEEHRAASIKANAVSTCKTSPTGSCTTTSSTTTATASTSPLPCEDPTHLEATVQTLSAENQLLRDRLQQLGVSLDSSPLSDQEKEMLLNKVSSMSQNGGDGPSSMGAAVGGGSSCGDRLEWDNKSSSSISEVSVACLQDRIQQMEETHYCTNEELQATLQELDDLREQLRECQVEIQQLQEEKQVILESLTQQTEKLNEARAQNDTLKQMLIQHAENSEDLSQCEKTQRLMDLLKSAQEDRELLQMKQEDLEQQIAATKDVEQRFHHDSQLIRDRMKLLESMVESANSEKRSAEAQLAEAQEAVKASEIETCRLKTALETAKEKIVELEAAVVSGEKSELADVLERVRQEKDKLEKDIAALQQQVDQTSCENTRLRDQISSTQDELMVARNNAKSQLGDLEWQKTQVEEERSRLEEEIDVLKATVADLQLTCQHHLEDKRDLKASLSDSQKKVNDALERLDEAERCFNEERNQFAKRVEEWEQFQTDLLMTVRVANDFKTEAQHDLERITQENQMLKDRLKQLDQDLEKARGKVCTPPVCTTERRSTLRSISAPLTNGDQILPDRRNPRPLARGDSRVKSLIVQLSESIENATKQARAGSRSSSTSSICSTSSESNIKTSSTLVAAPLLKRADTEGVIRNTSSPSPLKDSGNTLGTSSSPLRSLQRNSFTEGIMSYSKSSTTNLSDTVKMSQLGEKINHSSVTESIKPSNSENSKPVSILSNKIDQSIRRNSFGQIGPLVDKKDPLASLAQGGGSKRNALLKWCQNKTLGYINVDITNFSSSWSDGLALCALLDSYLPDKISYRSLSPSNQRHNFEVAIAAAESVGISNTLDINDMITSERPNWKGVYSYVTSIYAHFET